MSLRCVPDDRDQLKCVSFRNDVSSQETIVVTEEALAMADNDVQFFVDCAQPNDTIVFKLKIVETTSAITLNKPLMLKGIDGSEVQFVCPSGRTIFNIRCATRFLTKER